MHLNVPVASICWERSSTFQRLDKTGIETASDVQHVMYCCRAGISRRLVYSSVRMTTGVDLENVVINVHR